MKYTELFELGMDRNTHFRVLRTVPEFGSKINLGGGTKEMPPGVIPCGYDEGWNANAMPLPYASQSCSEIFALHFLEHVTSVPSVLSECQRVMKHGAIMHIVVPYGTCHMAIQDLDHKNFFNEDTWRHLFSNPYYDPAADDLGRIREVWKLEVITNMIMGVKGENLALVTQLLKT